MQVLYPNWKPSGDLKFVVSVWEEYLKDYTYEQIFMALKGFVATDRNGFAPSVGQLIESLDNINNPVVMNEQQAWDLVLRAIKNGLYGAEEEFARLPCDIQQAVGSAKTIRQWALLDNETSKNVAKTNFINTYKRVIENDKEMRKLPTGLKTLIEDNMPKSVAIEDKQYESPLKELEGRNTKPMPEELKEKLLSALNKKI